MIVPVEYASGVCSSARTEALVPVTIIAAVDAVPVIAAAAVRDWRVADAVADTVAVIASADVCDGGDVDADATVAATAACRIASTGSKQRTNAT